MKSQVKKIASKGIFSHLSRQSEQLQYADDVEETWTFNMNSQFF